MQDRMQAPALVAWAITVFCCHHTWKSPKPVLVTVLGSRLDSHPTCQTHGTPSTRPDRGRRSGIQRDVSHTGPLIFRQLPFKCNMLPDDLISSR